MLNDGMNRRIVIWLATGCLLIFAMVFIGGITRLTGSGLSMVDWNYAMGSFPPMSDQAWNESFEAYKQFPEYEIQPHGFSVEDYKSIFWWEYIHRMLGRFIGLVFAIPFVYFLYKKALSGALLYKVLILFSLGALQGFLGWYMVKSGLVSDPQVSHFRLAIHLITAFATFGWALWIILGITHPEKLEKPYSFLKRFTAAMLVVLVIQIIYGAFVAGLKAGLFFNTFPKMGERWIAEGVFAMAPVYRNFLEGIAGVQFVHRYVAITILFLELAFFLHALRFDLNNELRIAMKFGMIAVLVQELLGVFTLLYGVPITLGLLHQTGAFILLGVMIYILRLTAYRSEALSSAAI